MNHAKKPVLFIDPSSLGYVIQGMPIIDAYLQTMNAGLIVEADARLLPLFARSYTQPGLRFVATDPSQRTPLPNGGKPQTAAELESYFSDNASRLSERLQLGDVTWSTLLYPEIAPPFNAFSPAGRYTLPEPRPGYLTADAAETRLFAEQLGQDGTTPVLISWNKGFSQHGDLAQQNLDAADIAYLIRDLGANSPLKLSFYNAVHGIGADDYASVNAQLPDNLKLSPLGDPKTGADFNLGTELDRYAAAMSAAKSLGGVMLGVGNTYQHLWYATKPAATRAVDQVVVLPHGQATVKPAWERQAAQPGSPTVAISKEPDFETDRIRTLQSVASRVRNALKI